MANVPNLPITGPELRGVLVELADEVAAIPQIEGPKGDPGDAGASAYEVAIANGFTGSEDEWLASLVGPKGDPGESIKGDKGDPGESVDVQIFDTDAEASSYAAANPAAIVFSREGAA